MIAFEPTIKMMVCIAAGVFLAKTGKLPPAGARGVSILSLVSHTRGLWQIIDAAYRMSVSRASSSRP